MVYTHSYMILYSYKSLNSLRSLNVVLYLLMYEFILVDLIKDLNGAYEGACKEVIQSAH